MCSKSNKGVTKNCSCKFAHLCKRSRKIETIQGHLNDTFQSGSAINNLALPLIADHGKLNNFMYAKEGDHI